MRKPAPYTNRESKLQLTRAVLVVAILEGVNGHIFTFHGEQGRILQQELLEPALRAPGDLSHLLGEALGAELAAQVVQGAGLALVQQPLEEEQQGHVPGQLILHRFHFVALFSLEINKGPLVRGRGILASSDSGVVINY